MARDLRGNQNSKTKNFWYLNYIFLIKLWVVNLTYILNVKYNISLKTKTRALQYNPTSTIQLESNNETYEVKLKYSH